MSARVPHPWVQRPMRCALVVIAATTMLACGGDFGPTATQQSPAQVGAVSVSVSPAALSLAVGGDGRLSAQAYDVNRRAVTAFFAWTSANPAIATVVPTDGNVTAVSVGTTTVTATAGALSATATVSVRPADPPVGIALSLPSVSVFAGGVQQLTALGHDSTGRAVYGMTFVWSSADPRVATVGASDGVVSGISSGTTTITAVSGEFQAVATVSVVAAPSGSFAFTRMTWPTDGEYRSDVLTFSAGDRAMQRLPRVAQFGSISAPAWSPDGALLAVEVVHRFEQGCPWMDYSSDLYVLSAAAPGASPWRALTTNGFSKSPSWSPDGKRIAYVQQSSMFSKTAIFVIDAVGGQPTRVTPTDGWYSYPRWSPDGSRLAFSAWEGDSFTNSEIYVVNVDGTGLTNITQNPAYDADPDWSPDGTQLVFVSDRTHAPGADVFVVDANGRNVKRLAAQGSYSATPMWSPDGRHILFVSDGSIYLMTASGSALVRLTTPPSESWDAAPVWVR